MAKKRKNQNIEEILDGYMDASNEFNDNPEVIELTERLNKIHKKICDKHINPNSDDFDKACNIIGNNLKEETDPDEMDIFDYLWITN